MRIFVIGAGGFIGSHLIHRLLKQTNWTIIGIDVDFVRLGSLLKHPRFEFRQEDITNCRKWVDDRISDCEIVLPLAACALPKRYVEDPISIFELDFEENLRIVRECVRRGTRLIFPSTSEVYGMCTDATFDELTSPLVLGSVQKHRWIYSSCKQLLDRLIVSYGSKGLEFTIFRPFNWFGPQLDRINDSSPGSARVISQFLGHLLRGEPISLIDGGEQRRCFTAIDDGIDALMLILQNKNGAAEGQIFNIGNPDNDVSIAHLADLMVSILSDFPGWENVRETACSRAVSGSHYYGSGYEDAQHRRPNIYQINTALGWEPRISLREGLRQTIAFHLAERNLTLEDN
jgi:nucleoside-diphosphate-sugar epimerase